MGIDHEWTRIFTNGEGRGNGRDEGKVARGVLFAGGAGLSEPGYNGGRWRGGVSAGGKGKTTPDEWRGFSG